MFYLSQHFFHVEVPDYSLRQGFQKQKRFGSVYMILFCLACFLTRY